jgi:probable HAF family extracellular repeat protein
MRIKERFVHRRLNVRLIARFAIPAIFLASSTAWAASYAVIDLATLAQGSTIVVRGPNGAGKAVGFGKALSQTGLVAEPRGLVFDHGTVQQIAGLPGSDGTTVFGINDVGAIVGGSNTASAVRAFVSTSGGGTRQLQPLPGDTASTAFAVNNLGEASGFSSGPGGERAVVWRADGTVTALPGAAALVMRAYGINELKDAVGAINQGTGSRAVLWPRGGPPQTLALLPGHVTGEALGVNAAGTVVGYSANAANARRAALWSAGGGVTSLGTLPGGDFSQAFGINDRGDVVGASSTSVGHRAFLWTRAAGLQDLNALIAPSPFVLTKAVGINNVGMIVALGHDPSPDADAGHEDHDSPVRVFLLTPTGAQP